MSARCTVFIITSGEESLAQCVEALAAQELTLSSGQSLEIIVDRIQDVCPMSEAFNEMHRRVETPYFVQVDADMILKPHAVRTLYEAIDKSWFWFYAAYGQLFEEGFGVGGSLRIWRRNFFRFFKFSDCRTVDRDLFGRARRFGLRRKNVHTVLGVHRPRHSDFSEYLKTKSDVEKWRFLGRPFDMYAALLWSELVGNGKNNRFKILGFCLGAVSHPDRVCRSKDIKRERMVIQRFLRESGILKLEKLPDPQSDLLASMDFKKLLEDAYTCSKPSEVPIALKVLSPLKQLFNFGSVVELSWLCQAGEDE